jgi:hypothetical protein
MGILVQKVGGKMSKHLLQQQMIAAQQARLNNAIDTMALIPQSAPVVRQGAQVTQSSRTPMELQNAAHFQCWLPSGAKPKTIGEVVNLLIQTKCLKGSAKDAQVVLSALISKVKKGQISAMQVVKVLGSAEAQKLSVVSKKAAAASASPVVRGSAGALSVLKDIVKSKEQAGKLAKATGSSQAKSAELQLLQDAAVLRSELSQVAAAQNQLPQMEAAMDIVEAEAGLEVAAATAQASAKEDLLAQDDGEIIAMQENQAAAIIQSAADSLSESKVDDSHSSHELFGIPYSTLGTVAVGALLIALLRRERII